MKSMDIQHQHGDNGSGILSIIFWLGGLVCMVASNSQPSEIRAWITFSLGAATSITSLIINYPKVRDMFKKHKENKKKKNHASKH